MPATKRFCHHKINDQKINLSIAQYAKGFSLIELLAVIVVMAVIAGVAMSSLDGVEDVAGQQLTQTEMVEISKAIRKLKSDTGLYPNPSHPADFTDLIDGTPEVPPTGFSPFNKDVGRGWNGPYLSKQGSGLVHICDTLLSDGNGSPIDSDTSTPPVECIATDRIEVANAMADSFQYKPYDNDTKEDKTDDTLVWRACDDATNSACDYREKWGRPYLLFDMDNENARIVSMGANGKYDGNNANKCLPNKDDLVLCLKR